MKTQEDLKKISESIESVELVSATPSAEELIVFCARVSNPANQTSMTTAPKLIKYLIENKHWSPFEMAHMVIQIKTSRAIAQQILRHRSFSFQEFSQRYAEVTDFIKCDARRQDMKNRQNSIDDLDQSTKQWFDCAQQKVQEVSMANYKEALAKGIAKEQARFLLPLSTQTTLYMSGSLRSWLHFIDLRSANGTQKEHMDIAIKCRNIFSQSFPMIAAAMDWK